MRRGAEQPSLAAASSARRRPLLDTMRPRHFRPVLLSYTAARTAGLRFSFPLTASGFVVIQVLVFVHHLALAWGIYEVWRRGLAGHGVLGRVGGLGSVLAMAALAVQELVASSAAGVDDP